MFSSRLHWLTPRNQLAQLLAAKREAGTDVIDLTESNPTRAGIGLPAEKVLSGLCSPASITYEPAAFGLESARRAVAGFLKFEGNLLLTASTSEAYSYLFKLLADPGDEVLAPQPSYPLFDYLAHLDSVNTRAYPLRYHEGWWLDTRTLKQQINDRTRAVIVVNPNNPTGSYLKQEELDRLTDLCAGHGLALISDEVFFPFLLKPGEPPPTTARVRNCLTFTLGGFSKLLGLPQMKLGWIQISGPAELASAAAARLELIADSYLSVSAPVQHAAGAWLGLQPLFQEAMMARLKQNLATLQERLEPLYVEGGWYAVVPLSRERTEEEWAISLLAEHNVLVQPGYFYDFPREAYAVVSLICEPREFRRGIEVLAKAASSQRF
ncbi:MAG: pyridoxal phosphate-dependent aminotransferase [Bryobacterales bacterium]|nr:pyridoxal phosphate-dependent aminotransferase [Bryobacterales bacterium]